MTGPGTTLGEGGKVPTPEDIRDNWEKINSMAGAKYYAELNAAIMTFLMPGTGGQRAPKGGGAMDVKGISTRCRLPSTQPRLPARTWFPVQHLRTDGRDWYVIVKDGACKYRRVRSTVPPRPSAWPTRTSSI